MYNVLSPRGCVGVRISTIPAIIVEDDYHGHPLESRGIQRSGYETVYIDIILNTIIKK